MSLGGGKRVALAFAVAHVLTRCDLNPRPEDPGNNLTNATPGGTKTSHRSNDAGAFTQPPVIGGPGGFGGAGPRDSGAKSTDSNVRDGGEPDGADAQSTNGDSGVDAGARGAP